MESPTSNASKGPPVSKTDGKYPTLYTMVFDDVD